MRIFPEKLLVLPKIGIATIECFTFIIFKNLYIDYSFGTLYFALFFLWFIVFDGTGIADIFFTLRPPTGVVILNKVCMESLYTACHCRKYQTRLLVHSVIPWCLGAPLCLWYSLGYEIHHATTMFITNTCFSEIIFLSSHFILKVLLALD